MDRGAAGQPANELCPRATLPGCGRATAPPATRRRGSTGASPGAPGSEERLVEGRLARPPGARSAVVRQDARGDAHGRRV